jgi:hypothetical protein
MTLNNECKVQNIASEIISITHSWSTLNYLTEHNQTCLHCLFANPNFLDRFYLLMTTSCWVTSMVQEITYFLESVISHTWVVYFDINHALHNYTCRQMRYIQLTSPFLNVVYMTRYSTCVEIIEIRNLQPKR